MKPIKLILVYLLLSCLSSCNDNSTSTPNQSQKDKNHKEQFQTDSVQQQSQADMDSFNLDEQRKAFDLTHFEVLDISESEFDKTSAIAVSFSVPIDARKNYSQWITVSGEDNQIIDSSWILNKSRTRIYFTQIEPNKNYQVNIKADITSITHKKLVKQVNQKVQIKSLEAKVRFLKQGNILASGLSNGLAIEAVNIDAVDINFHRVNDNRIAQVLRDNLSGYSYYFRNIPEYSEHVYSARYDIDKIKNKTMNVNLPIHEVEELQKPGLYLAVMKPAGTYPYDHQLTSFTISDLALHTRRFDKSVDIHALNISDGQPQSEVELVVLSAKGDVLSRAVTDEKGNQRIKNFDRDAVLIARKASNFAVISFATPALDLSEQLKFSSKQLDQSLFLYGPRDLYRPGETVNINALLRDSDGEPVAEVPLKVKLIRPDNRISTEFTWHTKSNGFYQRQLSLSKTEPTGKWLFRVEHPSGNEFEYAFSVEEFLPETMRLQLTSSNQGFIDKNSSIKIVGQGDYLYGAPAAGNKISANLRIKANHFPFENLKGYYFGQQNNRYQARTGDLKKVELDDQILDESGLVDWNLPNLWQQYQFPTQLIFQASLYESGGRPVTRRIRQTIWPGKSHIGLRQLHDSAISKPYEAAEFELVNANKVGELSALGQLEVNLIRQDSRYYWRTNGDHWSYSNNQKEKRVYSRVIDSNEQRFRLSLPVEYGTYRIEIKDANGQLKNSYQFFAGWSWDESGEGAISGARPDKVRILFDQEAYRNSDVAKVKVIAPHIGRAIIRVESQQLLWEKQLDFSQLENEIEIPIGENWLRHDLYVSVMVVSKPSKTQANIQLPKRALGIEALHLNRSSRKLELEIISPELTQPEQSVAIKVILKQPHKLKPNQVAFITLAAVDTGVLSLSGYKTPEPHEFFYGQKAYNANIRDSFSDLMKNQSGQTAHFKFGGDAELVRGGEQPNTDVQIVSLFSDLVEFDTQGEAIVTLDLPSFNGELRLMALAFSDNHFGHDEKIMIVRAPLVAEISKPRFLALKDKSQFAFDLQNMSGREQQLTALVKTSHGLKANVIKLVLPLKDKQKFSKIINVEAEKIGDGKINLELYDSDNKRVLNKNWLIGIRAAYPAEFRRQRKLLKNNQSFSLDSNWIDDLDSENLQASIEYSSRPPLNSLEHIQNLFQYPYGCLEQTSSRAWPLLSASHSTSLNRNFSKLDAPSKKVIAEKNSHIDAAIRRINGMQRSDGSFGLWSNQSPENHWLSVYALAFLNKAKTEGYAVPDSVISKANQRLLTYVKSTTASHSERNHYSQSPQHYAVAYRAYAAYVLAQQNQIKLSNLRQLKQRVIDRSLSGLPLAHLAAAFEKAGDAQSAIQLWQKAIAFDDYKQSYNGDYGSEVRDIAWIMSLASKSQLATQYEDLLFRLNDKLLAKRWFSTQERFALYNLALSLESSESQAWSVAISSLTNKAIEHQSAKESLNRLISTKAFNDKQTVTLIEGKHLFIDLQVVGYPKKPPNAFANGVTVSKQFYDLRGNKIKLDKVKNGEYVLVRLDASASERMPDALLVDLIPAGFEIENPGLEFSYDYSALMVEGYPVVQWLNSAKILHQEYRDDRYVAALSLQARQWSSVFYLMRAVTVGTYQVPPTQVEDMYRPHLRSVSESIAPVTVLAR